MGNVEIANTGSLTVASIGSLTTSSNTGGEVALNPHGGQLSAGRTHGYGFVHEAVVQLRGDAGQRQVADAEVAVTSSGGGHPGGAILFTTDRG